MAGKFKIDISSSKGAKKEAIEFLDNYSTREIPFSFIKKLAEALGCEHLVKNERGKGSQERFKHDLLKGYQAYHGIFGIHMVHKGGDKQLVNKIDYKHYISPVFKYLLRNLKD